MITGLHTDAKWEGPTNLEGTQILAGADGNRLKTGGSGVMFLDQGASRNSRDSAAHTLFQLYIFLNSRQ